MCFPLGGQTIEKEISFSTLVTFKSPKQNLIWDFKFAFLPHWQQIFVPNLINQLIKLQGQRRIALSVAPLILDNSWYMELVVWTSKFHISQLPASLLWQYMLALKTAVLTCQKHFDLKQSHEGAQVLFPENSAFPYVN